MKRWQIRGEVEDSEEEDELSLDLESLGPGRPQKRAKLSQDGGLAKITESLLSGPTSASSTTVQQRSNEDDEPWLQPQVQVARTYGRKLKPARKAPSEVTAKSPENNQLSQGSTLGISPASTSGFIQRGQNPAGKDELGSGRSGKQLEADVLELRLQFQELESDTEDLPSLRDLTSDLTNAPAQTTEPSPSPLSSPLSFRDVTPPADFLSPQVTDLKPPDADDKEVEDADTMENDLLTSTAQVGRNLRSRKPEQLNPYQLERARYLQQCRSRGVKPIKLMEQEQLNEESPVASRTSDAQEPQSFLHSSSPIPEERFVPRRTEDTTSLDGLQNRFHTEPQSTHRLPKRRKLSYGLQRNSHLARGDVEPDAHSKYTYFDTPPSPTSTFSPAGTPREMRAQASPQVPRFRFPFGFTPAPLPTPEVSSEARANIRATSSLDSPPRNSRRSVATRRQRDRSIVSVSSGSDPQSEEEDAARHLQKEKKRIRGVLPASWLKIDFRAQKGQQSPTKDRPPQRRSPSPPMSEPQKGVARRIATVSRHDDDTSLYPNSVDGDSDDASEPQISPIWKQQRLDMPSDRLTFAPSETVEDDLMENDFVDPMLAGNSRSHRTGNSHKRSAQPRITDSFRKSRGERNQFSEERTAWRGKGDTVRRDAPKVKKVRQQRRAQPTSVLLSIADAPDVTHTASDRQLPQFVRLALRKTRRDPNRGRHSPSGKILRMPTTEETEEADKLRHAWREGTIQPRQLEESEAPFTYDHLSVRTEPGPADLRTALRELSRNERQQTFPAPVREPREALKATQQVQRRSNVRQTQLRPVVVNKQRPNIQQSVQRSGDVRPRLRKAAAQPVRGHRFRDAQIESLERSFDESHRKAAFERRMQCLTENIARQPRQQRAPGLQLERYLATETFQDAPPVCADPENDDTSIPNARQHPRTFAQRPRKAKPLRIDVEADRYEQPQGRPNDQLPSDNEPLATLEIRGPVLQGLGQFGVVYATDFNVQPLDEGTHFREDGLIGSGELCDALNLVERDLDVERGRIQTHLNGQMLEWAAWNEEVASQIASISHVIDEALQTLEESYPEIAMEERQDNVERNVDYLLRSLVRYVSKCLHFLDPIDRRSCTEGLERIVESLADIVTGRPPETEFIRRTNVRILQYALIISKQAGQIAEHSSVSVESRHRLQQIVVRTATNLSKHSLTGRFQELRSTYEENRKSDIRVPGLPDTAWALSSLVIINHVLRPTTEDSSVFWNIVGLGSNLEIDRLTDVKDFDGLWHNIFSILPALEIQSNGRPTIGTRRPSAREDWTVLKLLLGRLFELYDASSKMRGPSVNSYMRATLSRFYRLQTWGWWKCEPILNTIYDFFAHRNLALLRNEESRGSPRFLEKIDDLSLDILPDDCSFHIFLKLLAKSLLCMRRHQVYSEKKIQGIGYRLLPNHSRSFQKDAVVEKHDLDALRNHFDLLCTLHCTLPPGHRIGLDLVQNLIDPSVSHREACRLSVRAWTNIAGFQVSTNEPVDTVVSLSHWFHGMLKTTVSQFRLARSEAEKAKREAESEGIFVASRDFETAVSSNQQKVVETLTDLMAGMKRALSSAHDLLSARALIEDSNFWHVFDLFDPFHRGLGSTTTESLRVVEGIIEMERRLCSLQRNHQELSEDSQEFGDYDALQEFAANEQPGNAPNATVTDILLSPVAQFISNVFGADRAAEDALLRDLVDVWADLANASVRTLGKSWSSYVDEYSTTSWYQMRDTAHKRKFTPYFMARVIKHTTIDESLRHRVLNAWLLSLVEREAMLKFQHLLTSELLNCSPEEPLLRNLPFMRDPRTAAYQITLEEVRQRRLSLISSILHNMRESFEESTVDQGTAGLEVKSVYRGMLHQLMQTMKANYQELQASPEAEVVASHVQGAYVDFVQHVVSFLQQHTPGICRVDQFFTDSSAFPLPAGDPTYVVGRLRSYVPKLCDGKTRKQLAAFVHSVSERAATDSEQAYLVSQLSTAMKGVREKGNRGAPSLRHVLLTSIFPAYLDKALSTPCLWILALPILEAAQQVIPDLMYSMQLDDDRSIVAAVEMLTAMLACIEREQEVVLANPGSLATPHVQRTLRAMCQVGQSCLTLSSYIGRSTQYGEGLSKRLGSLFNIADILEAHLHGYDEVSFLDEDSGDRQEACPWLDSRIAADRQVQASLNASWYESDGRYYVRRGNMAKEVAVSLEEGENERQRLSQAIGHFRRAAVAICGRQNRRRQSVDGDDILGGILM